MSNLLESQKHHLEKLFKKLQDDVLDEEYPILAK